MAPTPPQSKVNRRRPPLKRSSNGTQKTLELSPDTPLSEKTIENEVSICSTLSERMQAPTMTPPAFWRTKLLTPPPQHTEKYAVIDHVKVSPHIHVNPTSLSPSPQKATSENSLFMTSLNENCNVIVNGVSIPHDVGGVEIQSGDKIEIAEQVLVYEGDGKFTDVEAKSPLEEYSTEDLPAANSSEECDNQMDRSDIFSTPDKSVTTDRRICYSASKIMSPPSGKKKRLSLCTPLRSCNTTVTSKIDLNTNFDHFGIGNQMPSAPTSETKKAIAIEDEMFLLGVQPNTPKETTPKGVYYPYVHDKVSPLMCQIKQQTEQYVATQLSPNPKNTKTKSYDSDDSCEIVTSVKKVGTPRMADTSLIKSKNDGTASPETVLSPSRRRVRSIKPNKLRSPLSTPNINLKRPSINFDEISTPATTKKQKQDVDMNESFRLDLFKTPTPVKIRPVVDIKVNELLLASDAVLTDNRSLFEEDHDEDSSQNKVSKVRASICARSPEKITRTPILSRKTKSPKITYTPTVSRKSMSPRPRTK